MRVTILISVFLGAALALPTVLPAQDLRQPVERYADATQKEILSNLMAALQFPAVAADEVNIRRKASYLRAELAQRGFLSEILETDGNPLVYGNLSVPGASRTLLLYCHYDGQPVDPAKWQQADPFQPVMVNGKLSHESQVIDFAAAEFFDDDWRIYARSTSDDTAPIIGLLVALDALKAAGIPMTSNIKVILDGEEEDGSPSLVPAIERYRDRLAADLLLIFDGPLPGAIKRSSRLIASASHTCWPATVVRAISILSGTDRYRHVPATVLRCFCAAIRDPRLSVERLSAAVCDRPEGIPVAAGLGQRDSFLHQHDCIVNFTGHGLKFRSLANRVEVGVERQWPAI